MTARGHELQTMLTRGRRALAGLPPRGWRSWAAAALAYLCLCAVVLLLVPGGWTGTVGNVLAAPAAIVAARAALGLRATGLAPRLRRAWSYLGLALWLWALGGLVWGLYVVVQARLPLPSLGDPLYMAGDFLCIAALLSFLALPGGRLGRFRQLLDMVVLTVAVAVMGWLLLLQPVLTLMPANPLLAAWMVIYLALDVLLVVMLADALVALEPGEFRTAWGWISVGVIVFIAADVLYTFLDWRGEAGSHLVFELGRVAATALLGLGAIYQRSLMEPRQLGQAVDRGLVGGRWRLIQRVQAVLPVAAIIALGWYTFFEWQISGRPDPLAVTTTVLLGLGLVARQGVVAGEVELSQYAHLVNSVADPAFICDAAGRLRLVNPALVAAAGCNTARELLGRPVQALLVWPAGPEPAEAGPGDAAQLLRVGMEQGWSGEVELVPRTGARCPAYLALRPVETDTASRPMLAGIAHDLTEQKRRQAELRQAYEQVTSARRDLEALNAQLEQKVQEKTRSLSEAYEQLAQQNLDLQALDRLKSEFVSLVSHELRGPLTNIGGGLELALMRPETLPPPAREALALVQAEISRLTQFVESILDLSALEAGRLPLYPAPLSLYRAAATVREKFATGQPAGVPCAGRLCLDLPPGLPMVLADERGLTSVLFHLVDNALKYAPQGLVEVEAHAAGQQVLVSVTDHGPGIPPDLRQNLFGRFQRLNAGDAQSVYGHGLGLYMVRRFLQAMGGDVSMETAPGGGARFTFWLPAASMD
jgi:PAS domain S-box-containing protein